jgi:anti-sigma factor RsiW
MSVAHPAPQLLERYHDGELQPAKRAAVETHVGVCEECRDRIEGLSLLGSLVREAVETDMSGFDPERIWANVQPRLAQARPLPIWERWADTFAEWVSIRHPASLAAGGLAAAAALALVLSVGPTGASPAPSAPAPGLAAASNECYVDSVETGEGDMAMVNTTLEGETVIWLFAAVDE